MVNDGASLTPVTVIRKFCGALVSTPPFAVPPVSTATSVIVADPKALAAGVYVSVPLAATAGAAENRAAFVLPVTLKLTVCPASFAGPWPIAVAHPTKVWAPASSSMLWSAPFVKLGASLTVFTVIVKLCVGELSTPPLTVPPLS